MTVSADTLLEEELLLAGARAAAGEYRELGTGRTIKLEREDTLPATLDGRVACYIRIANTWQHIATRTQTRGEAG
jgi:hypothetical protein